MPYLFYIADNFLGFKVVETDEENGVGSVVGITPDGREIMILSNLPTGFAASLVRDIADAISRKTNLRIGNMQSKLVDYIDEDEDED